MAFWFGTYALAGCDGGPGRHNMVYKRIGMVDRRWNNTGRLGLKFKKVAEEGIVLMAATK